METVAEVLNDTTAKIAKSFDALKAQFAGLRTGKASPAGYTPSNMLFVNLLSGRGVWRAEL